MIEQDSSKIFLSEERGHNESSAFRSYSTFNFGKYFNSNKEAFGALYVLNDDTIAGGCSATMVIDRDCYSIIIPLVGGMDYHDSAGNSFYISAGEVFMLPVSRGFVIALSNPYEDALVNYLHLRVKMKTYIPYNIPFIFNPDFGATGNGFTEVISPAICRDMALPFAISLVKLRGRSDVLYSLSKASGGLYAYSIQGAFEVQYRLLQPRDGLALWDVKEIEAEALSNEAILMVIELYEPG
ncbi:MAG: hypothetical protein JST63_20545 [Bacteroidetes bacterium]|nr:hypothetical protein [Bacteroidota bacterium]